MTKQELLEEAIRRIDVTKDVVDEDVERILDALILEYGRTSYVSLVQKLQLRRELFNAIRRLDVLQELLEDESITEIMVNGYDTIFVEQNGEHRKLEYGFQSPEKLEDVIQQIVAGCNRVVNTANPIVDARLATGERINIVLPPIALNGPIMTIRKFPKQKLTMQHLISYGSISEEAARCLELLVVSGYNIFISGGTSAGKTTFLNALSQYIPKGERIITIEDSAELQIQGVSNLVRLETRNANESGSRGITIRDLLKTSLRMKPDRIIVGEIRDEAAIDMLGAMNTGHDGSLSTGHANSARDMLARLETMVLLGEPIPMNAIRGQIASAIDIVVHLGRSHGKPRHVVEIVELEAVDKREEYRMNTLFGLDEEGNFVRIGCLKHIEKLKREGCYEEWKRLERGGED